VLRARRLTCRVAKRQRQRHGPRGWVAGGRNVCWRAHPHRPAPHCAGGPAVLLYDAHAAVRCVYDNAVSYGFKHVSKPCLRGYGAGGA
jgi:hypothetical protein